MNRHLLGIQGMDQTAIGALLQAASQPQTTPLAGKLVMNLFLENSTRTRLSFDMAAQRLGARVVTMTADGSSIKKGETTRDTLLTLAAMRPDALVIRCSENGAAHLAADIFNCPVINAGDGTGEHPTQALLDALTLTQRFGTLHDLRITIVGDILHSRVAHSNAILLSTMGAKVTLCGPAELLPAPDASWLPKNATLSDNLDHAVDGAQAVMALRLQKERFATHLKIDEHAYHHAFGITQARLAPDCVVMHPGPMNRGVEIDDALADHPTRSLILQQVANGVTMRAAILAQLLDTTHNLKVAA